MEILKIIVFSLTSILFRAQKVHRWLIYMVEDLIQSSNHEDSGFYLNNYDELISKLIELMIQVRM